MNDVDFWKFVQDNIFLVAVTVVSGAMLVWPALRRTAGGPAVGAQQATLMINHEDALVVDVRDPAQYAAGHVLHARNVPLAEMEQRLRELEKFKSRPVIVMCETGNRSGKAVALLKRNGFEKVYNLSGGIAAWRQAGLPTVNTVKGAAA